MRILSINVPKKERLEVDSKSLGCIIHAGSSPASGTILKEKKPDCSDALWLFRLPMPEVLRSALMWQKRKLSPKPDERLCKRGDGSDTTPDFVSSHFPILLRRLGLPHIRFHDLRHSLATAMRSKGTDMSLIQHWLGHSLITTTESIYAHFDAAMLKPALQNVNQILGPNLRMLIGDDKSFTSLEKGQSIAGNLVFFPPHLFLTQSFRPSEQK
jgi:hypothetical protein